MPVESRYTIVIDNISSATRAKDVHVRDMQRLLQLVCSVSLP